MRPRVKGGRTKEIKASIPVVQPIVQVLDPVSPKLSVAVSSDMSTTLGESDFTSTSIKYSKPVSLKDLCVEDKKRVANLIKELARISEEKENAEKNLEQERKHYIEQVMKLVEQQEQLMKEREDVERKVQEYQSYFLQLQKQEETLQQQKASAQIQQVLVNNRAVLRPAGDAGNTHCLTCHAPVSDSTHCRTCHAPISDRTHCVKSQVLGSPRVQSRTDVEQPSENLYMNETENLSTEAQPSASYTERPFTAMINQEIANQQQILALSLKSPGPTHHSTHKMNPQSKNLSSQISPQEDRKSNENFLDTQASSHRSKQPNMDTYGNTESLKPEKFGNSDLLTPEKNELISRFIESQAEVLKTKLDSNQMNGNIMERAGSEPHHTKLVREKKKRRKPPVTSHGPLLAPIMSSTQKSSEIGDFVDSTFDLHENDGIIEYDEMEDLNSNNNNNDGEESDKNSGGKAQKNGRDSRIKLGRVTSKHADIGKLEDAGVNQEFLRKYKKMSASERKQELLRQRTLLLEEQNRLRLLLATQETQLKLKQMEALTKMEEMESSTEQDEILRNSLKGKEDHVEAKKLEAHKEKRIAHGLGHKELLAQKELGQKTGHSVRPTKELDGADVAERHVVKKLDYSFHSDSEGELSSSTLSAQSSKQKPAQVSAQVPVPKETNHTSDVTPQKSHRVDVSTNISYVHLPRNFPELSKGRDTKVSESGSPTPSTGAQPRSIETKTMACQATLADALSIVDVISSMDDGLSPLALPPPDRRRKSTASYCSSSHSSPSDQRHPDLYPKPDSQTIPRRETLNSGRLYSPTTSDLDPNLGLFVLERNLIDSPLVSSSAQRNKHPGHEDTAIEDVVNILYQDDGRVKKSDNNNFFKKPTKQNKKINNQKSYLLEAENDETNSDLEESQILEEVFFI
ncbi:uncharacterized protein LOC131929070 isoform X2 [Physella acuta]|nr:uncharacterized protein LOC131929070 isoform X2 [Physella acuta]